MKQQIDEFEKVEYQQIHQTFRASIQTLVNVFSFFGIANVTLVGYIASQQKAGFFLLGALIWFAALVVFNEYRRYMIPFSYRAVELEEKHYFNKDGVISLFLQLFYSLDFVEKLNQVSKIKDASKRSQAFFRLKPDTDGHTSLIVWMIMAVVGQVLAVPFFIYFFKWGLF